MKNKLIYILIFWLFALMVLAIGVNWGGWFLK